MPVVNPEVTVTVTETEMAGVSAITPAFPVDLCGISDLIVYGTDILTVKNPSACGSAIGDLNARAQDVLKATNTIATETVTTTATTTTTVTSTPCSTSKALAHCNIKKEVGFPVGFLLHL